MQLIALKQHMMQVKMTSLSSLCALFKAEPETIRCLLQHLIRRGSVRQCQKRPACGSKCFKCPSAITEMYEWVDANPFGILNKGISCS